MSIRIDQILGRLTDSTGSPYSGAKLYVEEAGTSTPLGTFTDQALTAAASQPILSDAGGIFPETHISGGRAIKLRLTTSADVSIFTIDDLYVSGRLFDRLNVGMTSEVARSPLTINGNISQLSEGDAVFVNAYNNGANDVFLDDGYAYKLDPCDSNGDFTLSISDAVNSSGAGATVTWVDVIFYDRSANQWTFSNDSGSELLEFSATKMDVTALETATSANSANVYADSSTGRLFISTSSEQFKSEIEPMGLDAAWNIASCEPVWFRSTADGDNPKWSYWGFIAEDVAQIDARLAHYGVNEDGELYPRGVQYDAFAPALTKCVQDLNSRLASLEGSGDGSINLLVEVQNLTIALNAAVSRIEALEGMKL